MPPMYAQEKTAKKIKKAAKQFLSKMREQDFDYVWNYLITPEAAELLSTSLLPMFADREDKVEELLTPVSIEGSTTSIDEIFPLAFQMDLENMRTDFLRGIESGFEEAGWYDATLNEALAFTHGPFAILVDDKTTKPLMFQFLKQEDGNYQIDFESLVAFSMAIPPSLICKIGDHALSLGQTKTAIVYYQIAASFEQAFNRIKTLAINNPIVSKLITEERTAQLKNEEFFINSAKQQANNLLNKKVIEVVPKLDHFLQETFNGYIEIVEQEINKKDIHRLLNYNDEELRSRLVSMLKGVNPIIARRESEKPHGPFEISDMEVVVIFNDEERRLCTPVKSGREITSKTVPEYILYQIIRPFLYFPNGIVVFITAKPCSQNLHNDLKLARDNVGFAVEVIQHEELCKLLKINGLLN